MDSPEIAYYTCTMATIWLGQDRNGCLLPQERVKLEKENVFIQVISGIEVNPWRFANKAKFAMNFVRDTNGDYDFMPNHQDFE